MRVDPAVQRRDAGLIAQAFPAAFGAPFRAIARVIQRLMGVDDLVVAGSHGFDIRSPGAGEIERQEGIARGAAGNGHRHGARAVRLGEGRSVEPKKSSVCRPLPACR